MSPTSQRHTLTRSFGRSLAAALTVTALGVGAAGCGSDDQTATEPAAVVDDGSAGDSGNATDEASAEGAGSASASTEDSNSSADSSGDAATESTEQQGPGDTDTSISSKEASTAADELASLQVREKGSMDDYDRKGDYGDPWSDKAEGVAMAGNGCKTRDDILERDLTEVEKSDDCQVEAGVLYDPYGTEEEPYNHYIQFERGQNTSGAVQIDHIVPLGNVHVSGGPDLTEAQRLQIANDPINLLAVDGPENGAKGDKDASEWLPHNDKIHCRYAASQIRVKAKYGLSVTQAEHDTLAELITTCNV
ncbi:GmrSD restriction endonuclease domain-containing protein [Corynebacterium sp. AOP12-C2-36]|uniref:GmrSD restriction endonuclease domain-containing protein n=1 Tax=Corynebacterium sp. AOP12-C2-36 TaxID=3457723 RepID=UPI0040339296